MVSPLLINLTLEETMQEELSDLDRIAEEAESRAQKFLAKAEMLRKLAEECLALSESRSEGRSMRLS